MADSAQPSDDADASASPAPPSGELVFCGSTSWETIGRKQANDAHSLLPAPQRLLALKGVPIVFIAGGSAACHAIALDAPNGGAATIVSAAKPTSQPDSTTLKPLQGIQKWISNYRAKIPGVEVLQREIDQWMADYDARELEAKRDKEVAEAKDGWTVVVAKTGRKKTTDVESGLSVGAIALEVAEDRGNKKKKRKAVGALDFYRFQRHEACRNQVLELQERLQEDKKKIAAMKAARKFRPF